MKRKKILMACTNYWSSPFQVGSHHLARGFIKMGWDVAFVSDPISLAHVMGGISRELRERFSIYRSGGQYDIENHLWAYVPAALVAPHNKPFLRSRWVAKNWSKLTWPNVIKKTYETGFGEVDLLYFDSTSQSFWLNAVKFRQSILRIADKNTGFSKSTPAARKSEELLAHSVDMVIYTAKNLKDYVEAMGPKNMAHVPNGVNFLYFARDLKTQPPEYKEIPKPIAIYVGAMDIWFDYELINYAAERLPNVSFVLIGPGEFARSRLKQLPNIHILGRRDYSVLPTYLHGADVGIIPFDVKSYPELVNSINPLKLYEYMACGLPVVAVEWEELESINSPAVLCRTPEQFVNSMYETISQPQDKNKYIEYSRSKDWANCISAIIERLGL